MIDTLKLRLNAARFKRGCDLELDNGKTNLRTGERSAETRLFRAGDVDVVGARAYHNGHDFHVSVLPRRGNPEIVDATIHASVPGLINGGNNYAPTDRDGTARALAGLSERLESIGIETDLNDAFLSRVDLFRNVETVYSYQDYQGLLATMTPQRMAAADYGTGYRWGNGAQQICAYSKIEEMELKARKSKRDFERSAYPANVLRVEWRALGREKSQTALGAETAGQLIDVYPALPSAYCATMKKHLFSRSVNDSRRLISVAEAEAGMRHFLESGERFWFAKWWAALPFADMGNAEFDAVIEALRRVSPNRETVRRWTNFLNEARLNAVAVRRSARNRPTGARLYRELERKIAA